MLFPDIEIPYYSKVSKVSKRHFYLNFRFIIMRILKLLKRLPWFSIIIVVILLLIYKYANGQNKMDELQQALVESYREKNEAKEVQKQNLPKDKFPNLESQFSNVKDEKTMKVLSAKIEELKNVQVDFNKTSKILLMSSWKSGSDLVGDILSHHPKSFYHYEPLSWHGIKRYVTDDNDEAGMVVKSLLNCQYGPSLGIFYILRNIKDI